MGRAGGGRGTDGARRPRRAVPRAGDRRRRGRPLLRRVRLGLAGDGHRGPQARACRPSRLRGLHRSLRRRPPRTSVPRRHRASSRRRPGRAPGGDHVRSASSRGGGPTARADVAGHSAAPRRAADGRGCRCGRRPALRRGDVRDGSPGVRPPGAGRPAPRSRDRRGPGLPLRAPRGGQPRDPRHRGGAARLPGHRGAPRGRRQRAVVVDRHPRPRRAGRRRRRSESTRTALPARRCRRPRGSSWSRARLPDGQPGMVRGSHGARRRRVRGLAPRPGRRPGPAGRDLGGHEPPVRRSGTTRRGLRARPRRSRPLRGGGRRLLRRAHPGPGTVRVGGRARRAQWPWTSRRLDASWARHDGGAAPRDRALVLPARAAVPGRGLSVIDRCLDARDPVPRGGLLRDDRARDDQRRGPVAGASRPGVRPRAARPGTPSGTCAAGGRGTPCRDA